MWHQEIKVCCETSWLHCMISNEKEEQLYQWRLEGWQTLQERWSQQSHLWGLRGHLNEENMFLYKKVWADTCSVNIYSLCLCVLPVTELWLDEGSITSRSARPLLEDCLTEDWKGRDKKWVIMYCVLHEEKMKCVWAPSPRGSCLPCSELQHPGPGSCCLLLRCVSV